MKKPTPRETTNGGEHNFTIKAPGARSVQLAADFTHWQEQALPMKPSSDGVWGVSVALPPGTYHYRFVVDGEWRDDPGCARRVPNPYGGQNMVREVPPSQAPDATFPVGNFGKRPINRKRAKIVKDEKSKPQPVVL